jgi:tetratricopeptide (TPR) repeat protein
MSSKKQRGAHRKPERREAAPAKHLPPRRFWSLATLSDTPLAALALTLAVYLRCLGNGLVYDDHEMIVLNRYIGSFAMVWRSFINDSWWFRNPLELPQSAYYRPLQDVWLWANYQMFGFAPAGWHVAIVAIHLLAVWLVFRIARELSAQRWTPIIAATMFGVLPIHAQAVVWPTAIPLPLSAIFELAAFLVFIRRKPNERSARILAPLLYAPALLSHESAAAFPLIIAAYGALLAKEDDAKSWRESLMRGGIAAAPFFAELAIYLAIRFAVLGFISRVNITNPMTEAQLWLTLPSVIGTYVAMLLVPWLAGPVHPIEMVSSPTSAQFYLPIIALSGLMGSLALIFGNDRRRRFYLFCGLWMALSIAPALNLRAFSPLALVEDRYLYMPSVAWCLALVELAVTFLYSMEASGRVLAAATAIATLACAGILFHVESFWHDEIALFSTCVEMSPRSTLCHDRLGLALKQRGRNVEAEQEFLAAQEISPEDGANLYNLGLVHVQMGRLPQAVAEIKRALAMLPDAPAGAYVDLARFADAAGDGAERDTALQHAETLPDGVAAADFGRAEIGYSHDDLPGTETFAREAIAHDPDNADEWKLLGMSLTRQGRGNEALEAYRHSLSLRRDPELERIVARIERGAIRNQP